MELYRQDIYVGGWFSFNATKEDWSSHYAEKMWDAYFGSVLLDEVYGPREITDELLITRNIDYSSMKDKSVLVIGGGPSCELLTDDIINSHDFVFSCNHFFKNNFIKKHKVHLALIGDEVDLRDPEFIEYVNKYNPIVGFEHSATRNTIETLSFKESYDLNFIYLTRYFSRLGYAIRACVLARLMGAKIVNFIGVDGFKSKTKIHAFEEGKKAPGFNDNDKFKKQIEIFYKYMLEDLKIEKENFNNLSDNHKDSIYTGILDKVKSKKPPIGSAPNPLASFNL